MPIGPGLIGAGRGEDHIFFIGSSQKLDARGQPVCGEAAGDRMAGSPATFPMAPIVSLAAPRRAEGKSDPSSGAQVGREGPTRASNLANTPSISRRFNSRSLSARM